MIQHVIYLHGLASSPASSKARFFKEKLPLDVRVPDLNVPDFEHLTLTAMIERTAEEIRSTPEGGIALIGSSMGGLTAVNFTGHAPEAARVEKVVLMAPAFDFMDNRSKELSEDDFNKWRIDGQWMFYNYAVGEPRPVHYGLIEDVQKYDSYAFNIDKPVLIYHGTRDESVDYRQSVRYAEGRPNVDLRLMDSDHQLLNQLDVMLKGVIEFLGL